MTETITKLTPSGLAALMCARICHDLVSPVGALGTALEVLDDEKNVDMHEDAMDLVKLSARQASAKLQYLRLAFGAGTTAPGKIGINRLEDLTAGLYKDGKVNISWANDLEVLEKMTARLLLNLIMIAVQTIPRGGELVIRAEEKGEATILTLTAEGPKARLSDDFTKPLAGKSPEVGFDGRTIQPFYTGMIVRELQGRVDSSIDGERVTFSAFIPNAQT